MSCLHYRGTDLYFEKVPLTTIANQFDTPCYIYSRTKITENWQTFVTAFSHIPHRICYAVKANSNIAILQLLAKLNAGFDIVSLGELERVIAAGGNPQKIIFSGVGKKSFEIEHAINHGIYCFDIESTAELYRVHTIAKKLSKKVNIALRVNPDVNPQTHAHISTGLKENKFGISIHEVVSLCEELATMPALRLVGIACHIGSQITALKPFLSALEQLLLLYQALQKINMPIQHLNIGGGLGVTYRDETPPTVQEYASALQAKLAGYPLELILEPGRAIVANAGVLLTRVEYLKHTDHKNFAIVDAGMNDLLRPALYDAWQDILPVTLHTTEKIAYDIAGPVCESADFLGKNRLLALQEGDLLAIDNAGAYGFSMSSNYNSRPRPAEVLIQDSQAHLIRKRETITELFQTEIMTETPA